MWRIRLRPEALAVKIGPSGGPAEERLHVGQVVRMSIREALDWCDAVPGQLSKQNNEIARAILKEIRERLGFLNNVGLAIPDAEPERRDAIGGREPADPAGESDRLRADRGCSTCSTSPPSDCTSATTTGC